MRILMAYRDIAHTHIDRNRYDVRCVMHGRDGATPPQTIAEMLEQCPPGWKPDVYYHAAAGNNPLPADIEMFPGLLVCDVQDWDRRARATWGGVGFFDLALTDRNGCKLLRSWGYENVHFARLYSLKSDDYGLLPAMRRDIDILFIGSLASHVWTERNRWLDRVARLAERHTIVITEGKFGEDYVRLNNRAKIVFNRSVRGETNARAYEAVLCGALVFHESENDETREIFEDEVHAVYYDDTNLETRLEHYLTHEDERARIAEAGRQKVLAEHTETAHLHTLFEMLKQHLDTRYRPYASLPSTERNARKALQIFGGASPAAVPQALAYLDRAQRLGDDPAPVLTAKAALLGWQADRIGGDNRLAMLEQARELAQKAVQASRNALFARLTLGILQLTCSALAHGRFVPDDPAVKQGRMLLGATAGESATQRNKISDTLELPLCGLIYPRWGDAFDGIIEEAFRHKETDETAWKRGMLEAIAWQSYTSFSDIMAGSGRIDEAYQNAEKATELRPEQAETWFRCGLYAAMAGRLQAAADYYRTGLELTPLAHEVWGNYAALLVNTGQRAEAEDYVAERLTVIKAIPTLESARQSLVQAMGR
jgi:tetratricopeptide (TPR) repeat protein